MSTTGSDRAPSPSGLVPEPAREEIRGNLRREAAAMAAMVPDDDAAVLRRAAAILKGRSRRQPPGLVARAACAMLRRQADLIARESGNG